MDGEEISQVGIFNFDCLASDLFYFIDSQTASKVGSDPFILNSAKDFLLMGLNSKTPCEKTLMTMAKAALKLKVVRCFDLGTPTSHW